MQIEDWLLFHSERNDKLMPMNQLLIALRFYATSTFQLVIGDPFGVSNATVCRVVHRVTRAIARLRPKYVKFPTTEKERRDTMHGFYQISRFPGILGAIDCTHIPIQSPGGNDAEIYRNRKGYFSINVQLVCDTQNYISDVVARWPGSVHDSTIFDNSNLRKDLQTQRKDGHLVGDGGYACREYLLTPLLNPISNAEKAYNVAQISARNCIERTNGILKRRFPALKYGMRIRTDRTLSVIVAAVVLHNIAMMVGEEEPPEDRQLHEFIASQHSDLCANYDPTKVAPPAVVQNTGATCMRQAVINGHFKK